MRPRPCVGTRRRARARMATYGGGEYGGGDYGRDAASDAPTPAAVYEETTTTTTTVDARPAVPPVAPVPSPVRISRDDARATRGRHQNPGCFDQGGCCSAAPPVEAVGADGRVHRVNLAFLGSPGCAGPAGHLANVGDRRSVPLALEEIGMTWEEYEEAFVTTLEAVGAKHFPDGCCAGFLCGFGAVTFSLGCALPWICSRYASVRVRRRSSRVAKECQRDARRSVSGRLGEDAIDVFSHVGRSRQSTATRRAMDRHLSLGRGPGAARRRASSIWKF